LCDSHIKNGLFQNVFSSARKPMKKMAWVQYDYILAICMTILVLLILLTISKTVPVAHCSHFVHDLNA
jgi:hypothetical protein